MGAQKSEWEFIEWLYSEALELPADARLNFLKNNAENDAQIASVTRLLNANLAMPDFMQTAAGIEGAEYSKSIGDEIGGWRIDDRIGFGGMGEIYRVERHGKDFTQTAALKLARIADPAISLRFQRERQILARLEHPHIARLIDGGKTQDGRIYMVVESVQGEWITDYASENRLSVLRRLELYLDLCDAVSFAHGQLILHRDITPDNVLVDEGGRVKLIDFGVAFNVEKGNEDFITPVTKTYAAPEQLAGKPVSIATDIYALGGVLTDVLTVESIDRDLSAIISKCRQAEPENRYRSVDALISDIRAYLNKEPVAARGGGVRYRLGKFLSRYRIAAAATGLTLATLIAGLVSTSMMADRTNKALIQEAAARVEWEFQARTTSGLSYALQSMYGVKGEAGETLPTAKIDAMLLSIADRAETRAIQGDIQQGYDLYAIGVQFMNRYDFNNAADVFERLLKTGLTDKYLFVESRSNLVQAYDELGRTDEAVALAKIVLAERRQMTGKFSRHMIRSAQVLADASDEPEEQEKLIMILKEAIADEESKPVDERFDISWYTNQLGVVHMRRKDYAKATSAFVATLVHDSAQGARSPEWITSATNAAQLQIYFERNGKDALTYLPAYLPFTVGDFGDDPKRNGFVQGLMAEAAFLEKDWSGAEAAAANALAKLEASRGYRDGWYYLIAAVHIKSLAAQEKYAEASQALARYRDHIDGGAERGTYSDCVLDFAQIYAEMIETTNPLLQRDFESRIQACRALQPPTDDLPPPVLLHADQTAVLFSK